MTTVAVLPELCWRIADAMRDLPQPPHASLPPSEVVTWACMCALTGVGTRPFDRWRAREGTPSCPPQPARTRGLRVCITPRPGTARCVAEPPRLGVSAT